MDNRMTLREGTRGIGVQRRPAIRPAAKRAADYNLPPLRGADAGGIRERRPGGGRTWRGMPEASRNVAGGRAERHPRIAGPPPTNASRRDAGPPRACTRSPSSTPTGVDFWGRPWSGGVARSSLGHRLPCSIPPGCGRPGDAGGIQECSRGSSGATPPDCGFLPRTHPGGMPEGRARVPPLSSTPAGVGCFWGRPWSGGVARSSLGHRLPCSIPPGWMEQPASAPRQRHPIRRFLLASGISSCRAEGLHL